MKKISNLTLLVVLSASLFACKKQKDDVPNQPIVGFWKGNYGNSAATPSNFYAALIRADGTIRMYGDYTDTTTANKAEGTYQFNNNTITARYTYLVGGAVFSISATMSNNNLLEGTWGPNTNTTGGGTWNMNKQ